MRLAHVAAGFEVHEGREGDLARTLARDLIPVVKLPRASVVHRYPSITVGQQWSSTHSSAEPWPLPVSIFTTTPSAAAQVVPRWSMGAS
jgi:hypothetical protein